MKLQIIKRISFILSVLGLLSIFVFTFTGRIEYGWLLFIVLMLLSGIINYFFFRCPHCKKPISANSSVNQKYCPLCGADLNMKPSLFSYYRRCAKKKDGYYQAYSVVGFAVFVVSTIVIAMIVVAILGFDSIFKGAGRILIIMSVVLGILLGLFCRCIAGSSVKLTDDMLYFSRLPFKWKEYPLEELKKLAEKRPPFYHVIRGYVIAVPDGFLAIPVASYRGGQEFLEKLTEVLGQPMVDVRPDIVISRHSEEGKKAEEELESFLEYEEKAEVQ